MGRSGNRERQAKRFDHVTRSSQLLVKLAAKRQQSVNAEINFLLTQALKGEGITDRAERGVRKLEGVMTKAQKMITRLEKATDEFGAVRAELADKKDTK